MRTSDQGIFALMIHEGIVPGPYKDSVGVWTFGIGHTKAAGEPNPAMMPMGMPADLDAALARVFEVFRKDLERYEREVAAAITVPVSQMQFDAAVSFHYNTGAIRKASWVKKLNAGDQAGAAKAIMNWSKPKAIIPRRKAEQKLFRNGGYPTGKATVWGVDRNGNVKWTPVRTIDKAEAMALLRGSIVHDMPEEQAEGAGVVAVGIATLIALAGGALAALWDKIAALFGG